MTVSNAVSRFDADCPSTHPVKLPEVHFYFRIKEYKGGEHVFSDGSSTYHADYFSGWDAPTLQNILDGCSNPSDAASPDQFCETLLTFRQAKTSGVQSQDDDISAKLQEIQTTQSPNLQATVSTEAIDNIAAFPRGACTGTVVEAGSGEGGGDGSGGDNTSVDGAGGEGAGSTASFGLYVLAAAAASVALLFY